MAFDQRWRIDLAKIVHDKVEGDRLMLVAPEAECELGRLVSKLREMFHEMLISK